MINIPEKEQLLSGYKFVDLFASIGGFHCALKSFGATCVFASEIDKKASEVYHKNHQISPFGDITKINEHTIPTHDILCGGFPCQAFSISGKQKGFEDTRGTLFFDIARIVKHHSSKVLFLENVKNFVKHDQGNTLKTVVKTLEDLNYSVFYQVLNTSDFGLPQNRERLYMVCFNKSFIKTFQYAKSTSQAHKQFGNSVSINVLQYIIKQITFTINQYEQKSAIRLSNSKYVTVQNQSCSIV